MKPNLHARGAERSSSRRRQWQNIYAQLNQVKGRNKFSALAAWHVKREGGEKREGESHTHIKDVPR